MQEIVKKYETATKEIEHSWENKYNDLFREFVFR